MVGETANYRISDGASATWIDWTGAQVSSEDFVIHPVLPGRLTFSAEREATDGQRSIEAVASRFGPTINGPESIRFGQQAVFTATLASSTASSYWIDENGASIDAADYRFNPTETGTFTISLVAVDSEGIERGVRHTVEVES